MESDQSQDGVQKCVKTDTPSKAQVFKIHSESEDDQPNLVSESETDVDTRMKRQIKESLNLETSSDEEHEE